MRSRVPQLFHKNKARGRDSVTILLIGNPALSLNLTPDTSLACSVLIAGIGALGNSVDTAERGGIVGERISVAVYLDKVSIIECSLLVVE